MRNKKCLLITLPEELADFPIRIVRGTMDERVLLSMETTDGHIGYSEHTHKKYVFVKRQDGYLKISVDEIMWVEADRSYSTMHLTKNRRVTVSFNLAVVEKELPQDDFMRIHRSCIVNLRHVEQLIGNSLKIGDAVLTIGREFRECVLGRFIFIGTRRNKK